ncbi:MAG: hypothetical protein IPP91_11380 [Betaproteobacteria bacterium]|nr:hypothetical protein [Betaproteobacteria bacterium]
MKIDPAALEEAIVRRLPALDRNGDGKVNRDDIESAIAYARGEVESRAKADPVRALLVGVVLGAVVGATLAVTVIKIAS